MVGPDKEKQPFDHHLGHLVGAVVVPMPMGDYGLAHPDHHLPHHRIALHPGGHLRGGAVLFLFSRFSSQPLFFFLERVREDACDPRLSEERNNPPRITPEDGLKQPEVTVHLRPYAVQRLPVGLGPRPHFFCCGCCGCCGCEEKVSPGRDVVVQHAWTTPFGGETEGALSAAAPGLSHLVDIVGGTSMVISPPLVTRRGKGAKRHHILGQTGDGGSGTRGDHHEQN